MKRKAGVFFFVLFLFSACGAPVATKPAAQVQYTQTPRQAVARTPRVRPTSTLDPDNQQAQDQYGQSRFCQVWPDAAELGSVINVSAFGMPANDLVSIYLADHQESANVFRTDNNGYVNGDITVPLNAELDLNMVMVDGTGALTYCLVWLWSEEYLPTYYAGLTKTLTPTPSTQQIAITATQRALHDQFDKHCKFQAWAFRFSPDGQWVEVICKSDSIVVARVDGAKEWSLSSDSLIGPYTDHFVYVSHWSSDGAYVYVSVNPHTDGYWEPLHQATDLFRLDLKSGQVSEVLKGKYYSFAFSPNDRRLAYMETDHSPATLIIRDMQTGTEESFPFDSKYNTGGRFVWSDDSQKVVFSITQYDEKIHEFVATSIVIWDKERSGTAIVLKDYQSKKILIPVAWIDETRIALQILYQDDQTYELDLISGELKQTSP